MGYLAFRFGVWGLAFAGESEATRGACGSSRTGVSPGSSAKSSGSHGAISSNDDFEVPRELDSSIRKNSRAAESRLEHCRPTIMAEQRSMPWTTFGSKTSAATCPNRRRAIRRRARLSCRVALMAQAKRSGCGARASAATARATAWRL